MNHVNTTTDPAALNVIFPEITQYAAPSDSIQALLTHIGETFQCERVYLFERRGNAYYDCTYEWYDADTTFSKKHLMQNLDTNGVRHYYQYFHQNQKLIVHNLDELKQENEALYRILLPQNLESTLCGQMVYDGQDLGFIGIDNPSYNKFSELENILDVIKYYLSLQVHKIHTMNKLEHPSTPTHSLYARVASVDRGDALGLIYCSVAANFQHTQMDEMLFEKVLSHAENVLSSIFDSSNVFHIDRDEFLVFFEDNEEMDISSIHHYMSLAKTTLESINIQLFIGAAITTNYDGSFFELVQLANSRLLREKKKYRELYIGKYHVETPEAPYQDLIEIIPSKNQYRIVYSEYYHSDSLDEPVVGELDLALSRLIERIEAGERKDFLDFWNGQIADSLQDVPQGVGTQTKNFSVKTSSGVIPMSINITSYNDISGQLTLIVYTSRR